MRSLKGFLFCISFVLTLSVAAGPVWWVSERVLMPGVEVSDYAVVNQGQLKNPIHGAPEWIQDLYDPAKGSSIAQVPFNKHRLLAEMIPALTWPTGSSPVDGIGGNYNMASEGNSSFNEIEIIGLLANKHIWPRRDENIYIWKHSDVRDAAYCFTYKIFDRIVELANPEPTTNNP